MKKNLLIILVLIGSTLSAQIKKPTKWTFVSPSEKHMVGDIVELKFEATIDDGWYLYSNDFDPNLGPIVTSFDFEKNDSYELVGAAKAINPKKKFDELWEGDITYFTKKGLFIQKVKLLKPNSIIKGVVDYQTCTEKDGSCVPGKDNFNFSISSQEVPEKIEEDKSKNEELVVKEEPKEKVDSSNFVAKDEKVANEEIKVSPKEESIPASSEEKSPLWKFLLIAFGAGIASIFMPCIYPIMPMTVSFFTKQKDGKKKAFLYGLFIMLIFGAIGLVTMFFGAPFLNFISTHWIPNLLFFIIFILFGISLLGAFEIVLPHDTVNKIDSMSEKGGIVGLFFMALTLVVVSFSCTVPFVGSLLIMSANGEVLRPLYGMLAFGLPFAMVFTLLAIFPQYLKSLPKSGSWLNELKVVFGFLEFALALKFLSNIDLVYHFNKLDRNIFITIWIVIFVVIGLYILGFMRMKKDTKVEKISTTRWLFASIFLGFAIYMLPGVAGKPLPLLSGILPPETEKISQKELEKGQRLLPHDLVGYKTYDDALAYAKKTNKPVLIDFTGYACANCRKMEDYVWSKEPVLNRLKNEFVIASLYVDDKEPLEKQHVYISEYSKEEIKTIGEKNMDFEITKFNNNAQPYYVIVSPEGEQLNNNPVGFTSEEDFIKFLDEGLNNFKLKNQQSSQLIKD